MYSRSINTFFVAAFCLLSMLASPLAKAQQGVPDSPAGLSLGELVDYQIQLMRYKQWSQALAFCEEAVRIEGDGALEQWGPLFGTIYYRKGVCEMMLEDYEAAAASFETCHKDFPNDPAEENKNKFEMLAVLQWAKAEMKLENWQKALDLLKKFENNLELPRDAFNRGDFFIRRATCHYKLRQLVPGNLSFESALKNRYENTYELPSARHLKCLREMIEAAIELKDEQTLVQFIHKNRGEITFADYAMYPHSGAIFEFASEAHQADMKDAAMVLYQLMPRLEIGIEEAQELIDDIGKLPSVDSETSGEKYPKQTLESIADSIQDKLRDSKSIEIARLIAMASMHESAGNVRGAHAAYHQLEDYFSHAENREDNLYHMARTAFTLGDGAGALQDAKKFLEEYPDSEHAPKIKRLMFQSLFNEQKYEECIESASEMIDQLTPGTPDHDICLHVLGGSYFFTGEFVTAKPLLDQHVEQYPESDTKIAAAYFHASNYYRLEDLTKAAELLDAFIEKYSSPSENPYLPFALLDRATVHYQLGENDKAVELTSRVIDEFKDASVRDDSYHLRGNAQFELRNNRDAQSDFENALELAERWDDELVAAESLFSLAELAVLESEQLKGDEKSERIREAMPYLDKFWSEYGMESEVKRKMAIMQVPVYIEYDRLDDALKRLQVIITELAAADDMVNLEKTIPHYTDAYMEAHTPEELREHYRAYEGVRLSMKAARALFAIEVIRMFGKVAKEAETEEAKMGAQATVKNLFAELKQEFDVTELAPSILIKVGDYIRKNTSAPREALPFYTEVLERGVEDEKLRLYALTGRGAVYAQSELPSELEKGLADFRSVIENAEKNKTKEEALYNIVKILLNKKDYAAADAKAREFLKKENRFGTVHKANVLLMLGQSQEARGMNGDAAVTYLLIVTNPSYMGVIEAAAPATMNVMRIFWNRNNPASDGKMSDRQGAYEIGKKYITYTGRLKDKMTTDDLKLWLEVEKLVNQYEANPEVIPMDDVKN